MHTYSELYIGGTWVKPNSVDVIEVMNPATEDIIATVPSATDADADAAVRAARTALPGWSQLSVADRVDYVERIADAMTKRAEEIASVVSAEQGMPIANARRVQVGLPITVIKSYVNIGREYAAAEPERVGNSIVIQEPIGVCTFITPWNYPLHQIIGKVAPALVAGCTRSSSRVRRPRSTPSYSPRSSATSDCPPACSTWSPVPGAPSVRHCALTPTST